MATAQHNFELPVAQKTLWAVFADFSVWSEFFVVEKARSKGWGTNWAVKEGAGQGMKLELFDDGKAMQEWEVEVFSPPERLRLASRASHDLFFKRMASSLDIALTAAGPSTVAVKIVFESRFSAPLFGSLMNSFIPLQKELKTILTAMEENLRVALPQTGQ